MDDIRQLARLLVKARKRRLRSTYVSKTEIADEMRRLKRQFQVRRLPADGTRVAVAPQSQKIAALFFDHVWSPYGYAAADAVPEDIAAYGGTITEIWALAIVEYAKTATPEETEALLLDVSKTSFARLIIDIRDPARLIAESLAVGRGIDAVPVFSAVTARTDQYQPGKSEVLLASLEHVELIDDSYLTWEQVREMRRDTEARRNLRQLLHWLDAEMIGKSAEYIAAELDQRLQNYRTALQKHGILTATGVLESLIDPKLIASGTALVAGGGLLGNSSAGIAGAAALAVGRVTCSIVKSYVDLITIRRENAEIAFVYELFKRIDSP